MIITVGPLAPVLAAENAFASLQTDKQIWVSRSGRFHMMFESEVDPIVINRIHRWVLRVETAEGHPVSGAQITMHVTVDLKLPQIHRCETGLLLPIFFA